MTSNLPRAAAEAAPAMAQRHRGDSTKNRTEDTPKMNGCRGYNNLQEEGGAIGLRMRKVKTNDLYETRRISSNDISPKHKT